jgi:hypothetical protein
VFRDVSPRLLLLAPHLFSQVSFFKDLLNSNKVFDINVRLQVLTAASMKFR